MPIFSDNAPRIKEYASSHQTLTVHGSSAGTKIMQYNSTLFNNGPTGFYNYNSSSGYGTSTNRPYSIQVGQNGQYHIEASFLCNRTTTSGYLHCYIFSYNSEGTTQFSVLANHDNDAGPGQAGWSHKKASTILSVPTNGIVQATWYMYANTCSTYISHSGESYCYLQVTHLT